MVYAILLSIGWVGCLLAQEPDLRDQELWTGATWKLRLSKIWRAEVEQQIRFNDNISAFKSSFSELGVRYALNKVVDLKLQYRYTYYDDQRNRQRISLDTRVRYELPRWPLDVRYRLRLQDAKVVYTGEKITYCRNQIQLDYNLSRLVDPYVEYESFYRFNQRNEFRNDRYTLGLAWRLSKALDLETFYRVEIEKNVKFPEQQFIWGLALSYLSG